MTAPSSTFTRRHEFLSGCRDELPILLGVAPFGMIYGLLALGAGLSPGTAQAMSAIVFAGAAQVVIAQLVHEGSPGLVVVLTVFVVNLRHALYSASVAPYLRRLKAPFKGLLAYLLTDEAYAVAITRYLRDGDRTAVSPHRHWYYLGAGLTLWACWQVTTAVGIFLGARLPENWSLDFTLPLTFIALVVPALKDRASGAAAASAGVVALAALGLPYRLGLIAAALTGVGVGLGVEGRS
ncbi:MAG TPA: AzlC family ABC transporter permease [Anaeromyxobacteraceae bacterium]|nr:AzlC family ABC transporter permease [Anaeromyxobacteraceae bacterium]